MDMDDPKRISNSEDNIKALQANEKSLPFYKLFGSWGNEYISIKVNNALNSDMYELNKIANDVQSKKSKMRYRGSNGASTGAKGRTQKAKSRYGKRDLGDKNEISLGEEEVRSGLIALLTLHDLAASTGSSATAPDTPSTDSPYKSNWNNPESSEQLALFIQEVERLGSGASSASSAFERNHDGLRVSGTKASWKQSLRAQQPRARQEPDLDQILINDLAGNLLILVKDDLHARVVKAAAGDTTSQFPLTAAASSATSLSKNRADRDEGRHRTRGREKAKSRKQAQRYDPPLDFLSGDTGASTADSLDAAPTVFLSSSKRIIEITKVTKDLFVRQQELLFRPGLCTCLNELCSYLLLWCKQLQNVETASDVLVGMTRGQNKTPSLDTILSLFTPVPTLSFPSRKFWPGYLEVFRVVKGEVARAAMEKPPVALTSTAVELLKLGLMASVRAGQTKVQRPDKSREGAGMAVVSENKSTLSPASPGKNLSAAGLNATEVMEALGWYLLVPDDTISAALERGDSIPFSLGGASVGSKSVARTKTELVSAIVKCIIQSDQLDVALGCLTLTLQRGLPLNSKTKELVAAKLLTRGSEEDCNIGIRMLDMLFQRNYLCSLGTLKLFLQRQVALQAGKDSQLRDWQTVTRMLGKVTAIASRSDSRPRLLREYLDLLLTQEGLDMGQSM